jgi:hypothetical protein
VLGVGRRRCSGFSQPPAISPGDSGCLEPVGDLFRWYSLLGMEEAGRDQARTVAVAVEDRSSCNRVSRMQSYLSSVAIYCFALLDCEEDARLQPMCLPELIPILRFLCGLLRRNAQLESSLSLRPCQ